jgi:uncharacterized integral membrane protein
MLCQDRIWRGLVHVQSRVTEDRDCRSLVWHVLIGRILILLMNFILIVTIYRDVDLACAARPLRTLVPLRALNM